MVRVKKAVATTCVGPLHSVTEGDVATMRNRLMAWYDSNKRELPWRTIAATELDRNKRAYAVWVSEVMLQQTQVSTVVDYFKRWLSRWSTVQELAEASLEEVHQVWAGLGYYSRATRLHQAATMIVEELGGEFPSDRDSLMKLPGVGRYSSSAVASIALGQCVGVLDGNVTRVLARVRGIAADVVAQPTSEHLWKLSDELVEPARPGDFNQAMMELGATVCTPKNPSCDSCPLRGYCVALQKSTQLRQESLHSHFRREGKETQDNSNITDIECLPACEFCLRKEDWDSSLGVMNYPRKGQKTKSREETSAVVVMMGEDKKMLLVQRPKTGLLANLWEFPSLPLVTRGHEEEEESKKKTDEEKGKAKKRKREKREEDKSIDKTENEVEVVNRELEDTYALTHTEAASLTYVNDVIHIFSHIRQTYRVYRMSVEGGSERVRWPDRYQRGRWMDNTEFLSSATSTAMKKVLKAVDAVEHKPKVKKNKGGATVLPGDVKKQKTISQFFTAVNKNK